MISLKETQNDLTQGVIWKKLLAFFFPILLGLLFQQLYNTVDAVIIGRFCGSEALAAVGGSPAIITQTIIGFFTGLNSGASVLVAQRAGARDREGLTRTVRTAFLFCFAVGIAVTLFGYAIAPGALRLIGNPEELMEDSTVYLRIYFFGSLPLLLFNLGQSTLQAVGDSRRPLYYLIVSCFLNIALDLLFVGVLQLRVAGVAWASVISMTVSAVLALLHLLRTKESHRLDLSTLQPDRNILRSILRIGVPAGLQGATYSLSNLIIQASVNSFGTVLVAAWTATGKLDGLYWVTSSAFGVAICSFVGQCWGAGLQDRMRQSVRICMGFSMVVTVALSFFLMSVARPAYGFFLDSEEVIDTAIQAMGYFVPYYFTWTFVEVMAGTFRGMGKTMVPMVINIFGVCVFRIAWTLLVVPRWHTLAAVSIVYLISWVLTGAAYAVVYFRDRKRNFGVREA